MAHFAAVAMAMAGGEPHDPDDRSSGAPSSERDPAESTRANRRILIVEDDYLVALIIGDVLTAAGYIALGPAITGEEAVKLALEERPDLVLMDVRLAGAMNGVDAAIEIARAGIRSLFVTAHSDPKTRHRGEAALPFGWVEKPFSQRQLLKAVSAALP